MTPKRERNRVVVRHCHWMLCNLGLVFYDLVNISGLLISFSADDIFWYSYDVGTYVNVQKPY